MVTGLYFSAFPIPHLVAFRPKLGHNLLMRDVRTGIVERSLDLGAEPAVVGFGLFDCREVRFDGGKCVCHRSIIGDGVPSSALLPAKTKPTAFRCDFSLIMLQKSQGLTQVGDRQQGAGMRGGKPGQPSRDEIFAQAATAFGLPA